MSAKNPDQQGRLRSKIISFRISPEEAILIDKKVQLSGLTKQDYILSRLQENDVIVKGNPRVFKALKNEMSEILLELRRIEAGSAIDTELRELIYFVSKIMAGMKKEE